LAASFHYNEQKLTKNYLKDQVTKVPRNLQWIIEIQELTKQLQDGNIPEAGLPIDLFSDRIFVYSPVGDIYDLPEGATALDFAFAVHSDVGNKAQGVRINSKIGRLSSQLHNGDIVEIITRKNVSPKSDWLNHVKTTKARHKIRAYLNRNEP
jgi:GTP pyrophosphokinase